MKFYLEVYAPNAEGKREWQRCIGPYDDPRIARNAGALRESRGETVRIVDSEGKVHQAEEMK